MAVGRQQATVLRLMRTASSSSVQLNSRSSVAAYPRRALPSKSNETNKCEWQGKRVASVCA